MMKRTNFKTLLLELQKKKIQGKKQNNDRGQRKKEKER